MSNPTPTAVATEYFKALGAGDVATAMSLLSPDVVWHQPGNHRFTGQHVGLNAVGALLSSMMEVSEGTFTLSVTGPAMVNGELVAVPVRFTGSRAGAAMDMGGIDMLTVRDGRIIEVHLFSEDAPGEDAFWGKP